MSETKPKVYIKINGHCCGLQICFVGRTIE